MQVRAEQTADGRLDGAWLAVERHGGRGSAKAAAARLSVDGRVFALPAAGYEASRSSPQPGRTGAGQREERAAFALPAEALAAAATAISARFEAGDVFFDLTDEHLAAFAAVAGRVGAK
jgi:hypothetical protein